MENKFFSSIRINDYHKIHNTISCMKERQQQRRRPLNIKVPQRIILLVLLLVTYLLLALQCNNNNYSVVFGATKARSAPTTTKRTTTAIHTSLSTTLTKQPSIRLTKLTKSKINTTSRCHHHHHRHYYDCRNRQISFFINNRVTSHLLKCPRSYNNSNSVPKYSFISLLRQKSFVTLFPSNRYDTDNDDDKQSILNSDCRHHTSNNSKDENMVSHSLNHKNKWFNNCIVTIILITGLIGWNQDYNNVAAMTTIDQSTTVTTTTNTDANTGTTTSSTKNNDVIDANNNNNNNDNQIRKIGIKEKYWMIQNDGTNEQRIQINRQLIDSIVTTIMTMYYDYTGGALFDPNQYYRLYKNYMKQSSQIILSSHDTTIDTVQNVLLLKNVLHDPFAKYLSKHDLYNELHNKNDGFLGLGAIVEVPGNNPFIEDISTIISSSTSTSRNDNDDDDDESKKSLSSSSKTRIPRKVTESLSFLRYLQKETLTVNYNDWIHRHYILSSKSSSSSSSSLPSSSYYLSSYMIQNLPIVTGIVPYSPAERSGITVGDRIIAIQDDSFLSLSRSEVNIKLQSKYSSELNQYFGYTDLTIAKPIPIPIQYIDNDDNSNNYSNNDNNNIIQSYRPIRVQLPTIAASSSSMPFLSSDNLNDLSQQQSPEVLIMDDSHRTQDDITTSVTAGGNNIVRWQLLNDQDSIFIDNSNNDNNRAMHSYDEENQQNQKVPNEYEQNLVSLTIDETKASSSGNNNIESLHSVFSDRNNNEDDGHISDNDRNDQISPNRVGYIRLTRFSPSATTGFIDAIEHLEKLGATSYIIDIRNNYGGIIQSAMLLASSLLHDPHDVICFTMNSRGGFMPHIVEEFIFHPKYPGYLLSEESKDVTINQVKIENPSFFDQSGWSPPSEFASLREQYIKRGIKKGNNNQFHMKYDDTLADVSSPSLPLSVTADDMIRYQYKQLQKPIVIMINEGTASSSEVFASALHDNGRTVALIGTKTYGKGLIQHTFPLIDGGGLRITIAEYLTPALQHVSRIGNALYDPITKKFIGGGIQPDIICDSTHGIPNNIGADLCIGMALDVLDEYMN